MKKSLKIIPSKCNFTEEFITAHADMVDWEFITLNIYKCIQFSDCFFIRFKNNILWQEISPYQKLTTEFVHKYHEKIGFTSWYNKYKQLHRNDDEPAIIWFDEVKEWYQNGKLHRDNDQPAIIYPSGTKYWYQHGLKHRDNGKPAIVYASGTKYWYQHGKLIRENNDNVFVDFNE